MVERPICEALVLDMVTSSVSIRRLALVALVAGLAACGESADPQPRRLTIDEVEARLGQPGLYVYDANPREMYEDKHVPGARWVPWDHVTAADLPSDRGATLVFYCAIEQCSASHESAMTAIRLGYRNVFVLSLIHI